VRELNDNIDNESNVAGMRSKIWQKHPKTPQESNNNDPAENWTKIEENWV